MSKKFNLDLSKINSKKVPVVAKIESIYNIDYEELDISCLLYTSDAADE